MDADYNSLSEFLCGRPLSNRELDLVRRANPQNVQAANTLLRALDGFAEMKAALHDCFDTRKSGRGLGDPGQASPEWVSFFRERFYRYVVDTEGLSFLYGSLGLDGPLAPEAVPAFVEGIIHRSGMALEPTGLGAWVVLGAGGRVYTLNIPDPLNRGNLAQQDDDVVAEILRDARVPSDFGALVLIAVGWPVSDAILESLGTSIEYADFILTGRVEPTPLLRWDFSPDLLWGDNITLHIKSTAVTPEQVRAIYVEAREEIARVYQKVGVPRLEPKAIEGRRIRLVHFVEEKAGAGPYRWTDLHRLWERDEAATWGSFATHSSMKSSYYQSTKPWRWTKSGGVDDD